MAWVKQVGDDEASGLLEKIYASARKRAGSVANIIRVMSLRPKPLSTFMRLYTELMHSDSTLSRSERELLATVTSQVNECFY